MKKTITKRRIALLQLVRAIELLEDKNDPVCALTLAAAAEEILGKISSAKGRIPMVENWAEYLGNIYNFHGKVRPPKKHLIGIHNRVRNELKHNDKGRNSRVTGDFKYEAEDMLLRAIKNYANAFGCLPANVLIRKWFEYMTQ